MSLSQYTSEPPTSGRVKLEFSTGPAVVELWSRECPKACRNFVQLCLEGFYDGCIVHRIVKDYLLQTGDPTGTGDGGESVYGAPFKTEAHSRLQFTRRGLLGMAGSKEDNGSQFFITLGPCSWLNKQHTVFGRVEGNGIFNVIPMGDLETEEGSQRPLFPPKLLKATVLDNPFDDIIPREPSRPLPAEEEKPKRKGRRDLSLVSFGDEVQEEEQEAAGPDAPRMRSSHDVLSDDPRLLKVTAYDEEELRLKRERERAEAEKKAQLKQRVRAAAAKAGGGVDRNDEERPPERPPAPPSGDSWRAKAEKDMTLSELSMKRTEEAAQEYQRLKTDMLRYKKAKRLEEEERRRREADPQLTALEERRLKYLSKKSPKTEKEQKTLQRMAMFKNMLSVTILRQQAEEKKQAALKRTQAESDDEEEEVDYNPRVLVQATTSKRKEEPSDNLGVRVEALLDAEDDDDEEEAGGWMRHEMKCEKKEPEEDDGYVVLDPLNGNTKSKAHARLQSANADQRKRSKLT
nr:CWC27 [Euglena gracilis]